MEGTCNGKYPSGSYFKSGKNFIFENEILTCELEDIHGCSVLNKKRVFENTQYHNINGILTPKNYSNSYFITVGNQLGNCLRIITSGLIIANAFNKHPFIIIDKTQLLEKELTVIAALFAQYILYEQVTFEKLDYSLFVSYEKFYGTNYHLICEGLFKPPIIETDKIGITQTIYNIIPENTTIDDFIRQKIKIYQSLPFPIALTKKIDNFVLKNDLTGCIGIHIRHTDNRNDTCKNFNNFNTNYETFIAKINSLIDTILVCSDDMDIVKAIRNESLNKIVVPDLCDDHNFQGFYEMNLLSNCKYIIGTTSSTFSYEAAFLKGTNIELYENYEWKLYELEKYR